VLVAPLDWGLGHATRCIPIIRALVASGYEVLIAAEGAQAILLGQEFPLLPIIALPGYRVRYSQTGWWLPLRLAVQLPRLLSIIQQEHRWLDKIIEQYKIDLVISDNRYGLYSKKIPCIFITHQLTIKASFVWLEKVLRRINYRYINRYTSCWVPDGAGLVNAAGILSHPPRLPRTRVHYIGLLSRFEPKAEINKYDYCIVLSGPEPQRTLLEKNILVQLGGLEGKILLIRGKPGSNERLNVQQNTEVHNHLAGGDLQQALMQSRYIVSRSGYTTIMELLSLQKKSILIPTPGQTEQEYLAKKLQQSSACLFVSQHVFNCAEHFALAKNFNYHLPTLPLFNGDNITDLVKASV
jgi:uncharacterized protein (TIGR00661 family)